jgi:type III restriction enzyme
VSGHPVISLDQGLIDDVAARMDLRTPNKEALTKVAEKFDQAVGEAFEAVCDLATAAGKTYLAGAIIDYLAAASTR